MVVLIAPKPSFYTPPQLEQYLQCVGLESVDRQPSLENLELLMRHHITTFPFENTEMHYTEAGLMDVGPERIFQRFVTDRKGGSYCFGQNSLMLGILLALGYRAYGCAGRVEQGRASESTEFDPIQHMVILAQIPGRPPKETYLVDVGYGLGIVRPMLLRENEEVDGVAPPERHRLVRAPHPESSLDLSDQETRAVALEWRLETNLSRKWELLSDPGWRTLYQFTVQQLYFNDYQALSYVVANDRDGLFFNNILSVLHTGRAEGEARGTKVMIKNRVFHRQQGSVTVIKEMETEEDRLEVLREHFGIDIPAEAVIHMSKKNAAYAPAVSREEKLPKL